MGWYLKDCSEFCLWYVSKIKILPDEKIFNFFSGMFLEIGYWSKMFDWQLFFISKQFLVKSLHDQDQIWWKVSHFSSETFLEKVDSSKIVYLSDLDIF